jgi:Cys-rich repeat protein
MDGPRFDELTKALGAAKPSRREALHRLAGGALATVFGGLALEEASAQVGTEARTCGQFCRRNGNCNAGLRCGARSEECFAIPSSRTRCSGNGDCRRNYETCNRNDRCVNTLAPRDCPECRRDGDCAEGERCRQGRCRNRN